MAHALSTAEIAANLAKIRDSVQTAGGALWPDGAIVAYMTNVIAAHPQGRINRLICNKHSLPIFLAIVLATYAVSILAFLPILGYRHSVELGTVPMLCVLAGTYIADQRGRPWAWQSFKIESGNGGAKNPRIPKRMIAVMNNLRQLLPDAEFEISVAGPDPILWMQVAGLTHPVFVIDQRGRVVEPPEG